MVRVGLCYLQLFLHPSADHYLSYRRTRAGMALMDAKRITEIKEWVVAERELYTQFCQEQNEEALHLTRARVFFQAMRDIPDLLHVAEQSVIMRCGHPQSCLRWTAKGKEFCAVCAWVLADSRKRRAQKAKKK